MTDSTKHDEQHASTLASAQRALRLVCASLPHLTGLAQVVRLNVDTRVETAGVFASGRMVLNPTFWASLSPSEAAFVMAHELLHLALRTHDRGIGTQPLLVNIAHDYIINDILVHELGCAVPAGGLEMPGAREMSVERIVADLKRNRGGSLPKCWSFFGGGSQPRDNMTDVGRALQDAMEKAGLASPKEDEPSPPPQSWPEGDALNDALERSWYPEVSGTEQRKRSREIQRTAARTNSLGVFRDRMERLTETPAEQTTGHEQMLTTALRTSYTPPWEMAMQRWLDAIAPGERSYARPSRRGADRTDVVLPGRNREGWTLHIVLDSSGSMVSDLPYALGAIASFCDGVGVEQVHLIEIDTEIKKDEWVTTDQLAKYEILGLGGNDMRPAMDKLAEDPEVEAVLILTDEDITWYEYPPDPTPYEVLWVLMRPIPDYTPRYGQVIAMDPRK